MTKNVTDQILRGAEKGGKRYDYDRGHDPSKPADMSFQESDEGLILFMVFYSQACRWSRCTACNLPSKMSAEHVGYKALIQQIDYVFSDPASRVGEGRSARSSSATTDRCWTKRPFPRRR